MLLNHSLFSYVYNSTKQLNISTHKQKVEYFVWQKLLNRKPYQDIGEHHTPSISFLPAWYNTKETHLRPYLYNCIFFG